MLANLTRTLEDTPPARDALPARDKPKTRDARHQAVARRLRQLRAQAGFETATEFARAIGVKPTTYMHHENGRRDILPEVARFYAHHLKIPPAKLLYGEHLQHNREVPIVGIVMNAGNIEADTQASAAAQPATTTFPDSGDLVAYRVVGDDLDPVMKHEDMVYTARLSESNFDPDDLHSLECVVRLADGRQMIRQVSSRGDGLVTLIAHKAPPMFNVRLVAGAPIVLIKRHVPRRAANRF